MAMVEGVVQEGEVEEEAGRGVLVAGYCFEELARELARELPD
jgi:hypothetical protein